jgi:hypothetical protein
MNISPNTGVGKVTFGMLREEVQSILGLPDAIINEGGEIGYEEWAYSDLGLELSFDQDIEFRFCSCYITSKVACLADTSIIGLTENELIGHFPNFVLNVDSMKFKEYICPESELYLTLVDGIVKSINITPNTDDFLYEYSSKSYKRMIASKRLIKRSIRKRENVFVSELVSLWGQLNENGLLSLQSDFEWFLSERLSLDVFPDSMWCDGTQIKSVVFDSKTLLFIKATADVLARNDDSYQECEVDGFIMLNNNRNKMKKHKLSFKYNDKVYIARKGCV